MGLEKVIGKLTPLLLAGSISFSNCGKGEENSNGSCQDDWDCPGEEYCVNGYCQGDDSNGSGGNGNSNPDDTPSSSGYPQTPQALFDDFLDTLGEDVDGAVTTYIDAAVQKKYLNLLHPEDKIIHRSLDLPDEVLQKIYWENPKKVLGI